MMSSISYDASTVTSGTVNPSSSGNVVPLNVAATAAAAYMRGGITQPINASPDTTFMYQYVSPPLSTSSSPYATTTRDRVTQSAAVPAPSFLDYAVATGQLPYYCREFLMPLVSFPCFELLI